MNGLYSLEEIFIGLLPSMIIIGVPLLLGNYIWKLWKKYRNDKTNN